jgi:hypothetical protein
MKRTLKRELKVLEIAKREALETSDYWGSYLPFAGRRMVCCDFNARWAVGRLVGGACESFVCQDQLGFTPGAKAMGKVGGFHSYSPVVLSWSRLR